MQTGVDLDIARFYRERYDENARLTRSAHGQLEFLRTQEILRRYLPAAPARIVDVGGGTGVHARWLAGDGYTVHVIDPVEKHVAHAKEDGRFTAVMGDARQLDLPDGATDTTLLLGPLYHLVEYDDRLRALTEARRVTRVGGLVIAAAISRYSLLLELGASGQLTDATAEGCERLLATGRHHEDPTGFTHAHLHHVTELAEEMSEVGLRDPVVFGVEGPAAWTLDAVTPERVAELLPAALRCAQMVERDPALIAASPHLLGIGRINDDYLDENEPWMRADLSAMMSEPEEKFWR